MLRIPRRPFCAAPSPDLHVTVPAHDAAFAQLRHSVENGPALIVFEGDAGVGKTHLALRLLAAELPMSVPLYLPNAAFLRSAELHQAMLHDLGLPYEGRGESELWLAVSDAILASAVESRRTILVLDDADGMSDTVLADLRRLDNLSVHNAPAVHVLLIGSAGLHERARQIPNLASRLGRACRLEPLSETEATLYLHSQAQLVGDDAFSDEAAVLIATTAAGVPRRLNRIASEAISVATEAGEAAVDVESVLEAVTRLDEPSTLIIPATSHQPRGARMPKEKTRKRKAA